MIRGTAMKILSNVRSKATADPRTEAPRIQRVGSELGAGPVVTACTGESAKPELGAVSM